MRKRILSILLSVIMVVSILPANSLTVLALSDNPSLSDEAGTIGNPYLIYNTKDLEDFRNLVNGGQDGVCAKLMADIVLNEGTLTTDGKGRPLYNSKAVDGTNMPKAWSPIGIFSGTFDGNGHTVSGIYINDTTANDQGLFGYSRGTIKNVGVVNSYIQGDDSAGGVCGYNSGIITSCYNTGIVRGRWNVGGVCGYNTNGTITSCYNTGFIGANNYAGGVCGLDNSGTITNCYNAGNVIGYSYVGAVCGLNIGNSYITNCYYLDTCGAGGKGTSKTSAEMKDTTFIGTLNNGSNAFISDFSNDNDGYLVLLAFYSFSGGDGTDTNPYLISNATELRYMSYLVNNDNANYGNKHYKLTANIVLNQGTLTADTDGNPLYNGKAVDSTNMPKAWSPIGVDNKAPFSGTFDGNGYTVSGVYINDTAASIQGLFGWSEGTIKNVGVVNSYFKGNLLVSGVCGLNYDGTITSCYNTGIVSGNTSVGGVCASNGTNSTITNCYNTGSVSGNGCVGGVCGSNSNAITSCHNTGSVSAIGDSVGGVCGNNSINSTITNCYNTGSVSTTGDDVGGVCGSNGTNSTITSCNNTGSVTTTGNEVGGVCGSNGANSTITSCYNKGSVSATGNEVGGVCGHNSNVITSCYNAGNVSTTGDDVGGVCGYNAYTIETCYNTGSVNGNDSVAGVCGSNISAGTIANCYNTGNISGDTRIGGVYGLEGSNTSTNCYYLVTCGASGVGTSKTAAQMKDSAFVGALNGNPSSNAFIMDFNNDNGGYPVLRVFYSFAGGDGTDTNPYLISTAKQLAYMSYLVNNENASSGNKHYKLTADIVLNDGTLTADIDGYLYYNGKAIDNTNQPKVWSPIGSYTDNFAGTFDGNGYAISGIYINSNANYQGLFGYLKGEIKNVGVLNSYIKGVRYVGGVCGYNDKSAIIQNCYNTGIVSGSQYIGVFDINCTGGVCGANNYSTIKSCYNTGTVIGYEDEVGGVCGYGIGGTIDDCYNTGTVIGYQNDVGGVCGSNDSKITNCYNNGSVSGNNFVGGVCGTNYSTIQNCYNKGIVNGKESCVGGISGGSIGYGSVQNCYNTGSVSGNDVVGGVCGFNDAGTVENCYNMALVRGDSKVGGVCGKKIGGAITDCFYSGCSVGVSNPDENTDITPFVTLSKTTFNYLDSTSGIAALAADYSALKTAFGNNFSIKLGNITPTQFTSVGTDKSVDVAFEITQPKLTANGWSATETDKIGATATFGGITVAKGAQGALNFGSYNATYTYGDTFTLAATGGSGDGAVTYESSDKTVATVDNNGNITLVGVGSFTITATKAADANYNEQTAKTSEITVSPKKVTISGVAVKDKIYDGKTDATISSHGTLNGVISGDTVGITAGSCTFNSANAGDSVAVTASEFVISGADAAKYELEAQPTVANAKIEKATLTVSPDNVTINKGQAIPALTVSVSGFVNGETGETLTGFSKPTANVNGTVDTTDTTVASFTVLYSGGNATENYKFDLSNTTATITIKAVEVGDHDFALSGDNTAWQNSDLILSPTNGYTQISADGVTWVSSLTLSTEGENSQSFYLKKADGTVSEKGTITYKLDKTVPADLQVQYNGNGFKSFLNTITFGIFFKENVDVEAAATDAHSGIKSIEYYAADSEIIDFSAVVWQSDLSLTKNSKKLVYVKVTDNAGNSAICYDGVVVYTDSTLTQATAEFNFDIPSDIIIPVNFNDNTLDKIMNGNTILTKDVDYTVANDKVIIKSKYLTDHMSGDTLSLTLSFNPMGEAFTGSENAPLSSEFTVTKHIHISEADDGDCTTAVHCSNCGFITAQANKAHSFKWVTDKEATATQNGSKHEECSICGYKKATAEIPATGSPESPQTGDQNNMILWIALLFVSGGVLTTLGIRKKAQGKIN